MKIIVTGGAGFIGSELVELLINEGHEVIVLDNLSSGSLNNLSGVQNSDLFRFHKVDVRDRSSLPPFFEKVDVVFHLAALAKCLPSIENPSLYFDVNVTGTLNVLEASRECHVRRFIYAASSSCYGDATSIPIPESAPIHPTHPYGLTKSMGEKLVLHWSSLYGLSSTSLRLFNVYGRKGLGILGNFLSQKKEKKPLTIEGDGMQTRDFIYVKDVALAFYKALQNKNLGYYNVGSGCEATILSLAKLFGDHEITFLPKRRNEIMRSCADISKIKRELNWAPQVSLKEGISLIL